MYVYFYCICLNSLLTFFFLSTVLERFLERPRRKTVIIYVLIPVPWLFFSYQNDEDPECSDLVNQFGFCTSGMIFSSLFGLPFACYVSGKVDDDGVMTGWTIANLSILISITFIIYLVSKGDD